MGKQKGEIFPVDWGVRLTRTLKSSWGILLKAHNFFWLASIEPVTEDNALPRTRGPKSRSPPLRVQKKLRLCGFLLGGVRLVKDSCKKKKAEFKSTESGRRKE